MRHHVLFSSDQLQAALPSLVASSLVMQDNHAFGLNGGDQPEVMLIALPDNPLLARLDGPTEAFADGYVLARCPADEDRAAVLRTALPWLQPVPLGLHTSAGFGDRLGLATPGHVQALRLVHHEAASSIAPIFAQQSMRENSRTGRTPRAVLADATWGAFRAGWRDSVGADADHLKTTHDIDLCVAAGYSLYTIDPGAYVDAAAEKDALATLQQKLAALPWADLDSSPADLQQRYDGRVIALATRSLSFDRITIMRAAVKYGAAMAHVARLYHHLAAKGVPFELEVSVDETDTPTTHAEHVFIGSELQRLGVRWVSLAPRFVGRFEKGVEYIGDLNELARDSAGHAEVAQALGPYKLSLHSGSDKFSVYPLIAAATHGLVHLKTAGTSYVEALRVIAQVDPGLFRQILELAREHYARDHQSYHVSADLARLPALQLVFDPDLPALLDHFDARQMLHVTFGSTLQTFGPQIRATLVAHQTQHWDTLAQHFERHLLPFVAAQQEQTA